MRRDKTQTAARNAARPQTSARTPAWERYENIRRARNAESARHAARRKSGQPPPSHGSRNEGISRMESRNAAATADTTRNAPHFHATGHPGGPVGPPPTETPNGGSAGRAGNTGGTAPESAGEAADARQRAESAAREQPLYAGQPAWYNAPESVDAPTEQVEGASLEQKEILATMIASLFVMATNFPARKRSEQWPPSPQGEPAGAFWAIPQDEAMTLGRNWAAVIAAFAPPEMIGGSAVLLVALGNTGFMLLPRLYQDAERAREFKAMQAAAANLDTARVNAQQAA